MNDENFLLIDTEGKITHLYTYNTAQKMKFSIKFPADVVTFTEKILNGKLYFLCSKTILGFYLIFLGVTFRHWLGVINIKGDE